MKTKGSNSLKRPQDAAFRPERIAIKPRPCPPLRLSDCPRCGAVAGVRCEGIDRDDEVHVERVEQCVRRSNERHE